MAGVVGCRGSELERFAASYTVAESGCWLWNKSMASTGYGVFWMRGRLHKAHRAAWMLHKGPIGNGLFVCHNCPAGDDRRCVNPAHLFLGTAKDNMADAANKGRTCAGERRSRISKRGSTSPRAKLHESDIVAILLLRKYGDTYADIAWGWGVSQSVIAAICTRRIWKHVEVES